MLTPIKLFCVLILSSVIIAGVFSSGVSQKVIAQYTPNNNKIVILTFGDGWKTQFTAAKPILDKYGFKASFFITCTFVGCLLG
jgi:peptidoglycan/xylan/chitin deacetylase (PgdA/CDA1 family)